MESVPTLITVPVRADSGEALEAALATLVALRETAPDDPVLVVDDATPAERAALVRAAAGELECAYAPLEDGEGTTAAFNVGLGLAAAEGMDACLVTPGVVVERRGWLERLRARTGPDGEPAAVAGGATIAGTGRIQHAGYYFSLLRRTWHSRLREVPEVLLDVDDPVLCPVSADLQFVRHPWIERTDGYDEAFGPGFGALDFCLRVAAEGGACVYEPTVRGRVQAGVPDLAAVSEDGDRLRRKHFGMVFSKWVPEVL